MRKRSVAALERDLRALGVRAGDLLMVHASLRKIGPVKNGADGVLDAIGAAIGPGGTILMMVSAEDEYGWVNDHPEGDRVALLVGAEPFDPLTTPTDPEVGVLAEVFRTRPGTVVSDHPEGRFAASGPQADALVADVPWDDYYGPGSPLERFANAGGRVLRLGADLDTVTLIHYAEYLASVPDKRRVRRHRMVHSPVGPIVRTVDCLDDSNGIVDRYALDGSTEDYFASILKAYLATGGAATGTVGGAASELIDGAALVVVAAAWMNEHLTRAP